jgi:sec-independent protein translocase protein TatC
MLNISTHIYSLKLRVCYIFYAFLLSLVSLYKNGDLILYFFTKPFLIQNLKKTFIFTNLFEGFISVLFISIFCSICVILPLIVYHFFEFYKDGLFKKEKNLLSLLLKLFALLLLISFVMTYYIFFPTAIKFFLSFEQTSTYSTFELYLQPKILDYVKLNITFLIGLLLMFILPISFSLLLSFNFIPIDLVFKNRRLNILLCFIIGCVFSPPDIFSQSIIAIPLCICIEIVVFNQLMLKKYNYNN